MLVEDEVTEEEEEEEGEEEGGEEVEEGEEEDVHGADARPQASRTAEEAGFAAFLWVWEYPEYLGFEGPYSGNQTDLFNDSALDYLQVLWPEFLVDIIVHATNKYA